RSKRDWSSDVLLFRSVPSANAAQADSLADAQGTARAVGGKVDVGDARLIAVDHREPFLTVFVVDVNEVVEATADDDGLRFSELIAGRGVVVQLVRAFESNEDPPVRRDGGHRGSALDAVLLQLLAVGAVFVQLAFAGKHDAVGRRRDRRALLRHVDLLRASLTR